MHFRGGELRPMVQSAQYLMDSVRANLIMDPAMRTTSTNRPFLQTALKSYPVC